MLEVYIKKARVSENTKHRHVWSINMYKFNGHDILFTLYILEFKVHEVGEIVSLKHSCVYSNLHNVISYST